MSVERIAVATAVISAAVSAASLLLAWYRGSTTRRPGLARTLGGLTLASAIALIVALGFAGAGDHEEIEATRPTSLTVSEYRVRLIGVCEEHLSEAARIARAEPNRSIFGVTVQLDGRTLDGLESLRPPSRLASDHRRLVALWSRRLTLLEYYWLRFRREEDDPAFRREFHRKLEQIDDLARAIHQRFEALGVLPECSLFFA